MRSSFRAHLMSCALLSTSMLVAPAALAQDSEAEDDTAVQETIIVTGARGAPRSVTDSPVPIDVFGADDIEAVSFTDTNDVLRTLVPSYSLSRQPISDGASFIRPATLRGLPTDKTLVLVNSKRRHRAALVSIGGSGTQGPDIATIPSTAIGSVEVLRDGAAAQYGSDAIAGVINFILKENAEGITLTAQTGQYYEGDGTEYLLAGNIGLPLGDSGFLSISGEYYDAEATVRARQYCEGFACADVNDPRFAGALGGSFDTSIAGYTEESYIAGLPDANIGDGDVVQPWGAPNVERLALFYNAGIDLTENVSLYSFGNYTSSESDGSFFYRFPGNGTIENLRLEDGSVYSPLFLFPGGFTPRFFGEIEDLSFLAGIKGEMDNGFTWDLSGRYGSNEIQYTLANTINPSLGPDTPTSFRPGDLINEETQLQADFSYEFEGGTASPIVVAFGASYLDETYEIVGGDPLSFANGPFSSQDPFGFCTDEEDIATRTATAAGAAVIANGSTLDCTDGGDPVYRTVGVGSNGFPGFGLDSAGTLSRDSYGVYVDVSTDLTEDLFVQGALRYEDYSDFGEELVWKLAAQYDFNDMFSVRGSVGTGFRAPTPGQLGTTNVSTRLPNGVPVATGLFPASSPAAQALGADPLAPEKSDNIAFGFLGNVGDFTYTVDFYQIDLKDRVNAVSTITIINDIDFPALNDGSPAPSGFEYASVLDAANVPNANTIGGVNFFQNAFDTTTKGVDVVLTYNKDWGANGSTAFSGALNWNETEFDGDVSNLFNAENTFDFENGPLSWRANLSATHSVGKFTFLARANIFGPYENSNSGGANGTIQDFGEEVLIDVEGSYDLNEAITLSIGARNLLDEYPDAGDPAIGDTCCGRIYRSDSEVDWQGGFYYVRAVAKF
ncbi:MAG: TonB-dependent receptor [Henriciella sp.]|nr:TonB-dependent receptor [Henriciella sp.]